MRHILLLLFAATALTAFEPLTWSELAPSGIPSYSATPRRTYPARQTSVSGQTIYTDNMLRLNVGVGPAFTDLSGTLDKHQWSYFGLALDVYLSLPESAIKGSQRSVAPEFRKLISAGLDQELRPAYLGLIPTHIYLNPEFGKIGLLGATWQMTTITIFSATPVQEFSFKLGARLPTITIAKVYGDSTVLEKGDWLFGIGASVHAKGIFHFSPRLNMSLEWTSTFYLPGDDMGIHPLGKDLEIQNYAGTFGWLINYRFGISKI